MPWEIQQCYYSTSDSLGDYTRFNITSDKNMAVGDDDALYQLHLHYTNYITLSETNTVNIFF